MDKAAGDILDDPALKRAKETDYDTEFLALKLAVRVVASLDEAVEHIAATAPSLRGHRDRGSGRCAAFIAQVDAACVYVNASTRFTEAASSAWAPRWASPHRSCTSGARSRCRSSPASST